MKVLAVASHSGGHISPAVALCQALKEIDNSVEISFVTTDGQIEKNLGVDNFNAIFFRKERISVLNFYKLLILFFKAHDLINRLKPSLVVGFGGYLSIPFVICAHYQKIPNFIHEQNVVAGLANRFLANFSDKIIFSFPNSKISDRLKNRALSLGLPLREELRRCDKKQAREYFGFDSEKFTILIVGGSQGAHKINREIIKVLRDKSFCNIQVIHITGAFDFEWLKREYETINIKYKIFSFFQHMEFAWSACDIAISRAGANTITEEIFFRIPSILIPYPYAKQHQLDNARFLTDKDAAILLEDKYCNEKRLREKILELKNNPDKLIQMSNVLSLINVSDARYKIADLALTLLNNELKR